MSSIRVFTISPALNTQRMAFIMRALVFSLIVAVSPALHAQNNKDAGASSAIKSSGQVEVTADEVSGKTIIRLKPQVVFVKPAQTITMKMQYEPDRTVPTGKKKTSMAVVQVHVESTAKRVFDYIADWDLALNGKLFAPEEPFDGPSPKITITQEGRRLNSFSRNPISGPVIDATLDFVLTLSELEQVASGTQFGMRFGRAEFYFDQSVMANIRDFASEVARHAPKVVAKTSEVEIKTDRFSGDVTIVMMPQTLIGTPRHHLTMEIQYKKKNGAAGPIEETAGVRFDSRLSSDIDFGDEELHFLIDGRRLSIGRTSSQPKSETPMSADKNRQGRKPDKTLYSALSLSQIKQIGAGKQVEMRIGNIEMVLNQTTLAAIREFAGACAAHAPAEPKRKGERP